MVASKQNFIYLVVVDRCVTGRHRYTPNTHTLSLFLCFKIKTGATYEIGQKTTATHGAVFSTVSA